MYNKIDILVYVAAASTVIAGIIHIVLGIPSNNQNSQILFVVGGIAQVFWAIPMIRKWGKPWYFIGIGGNGIFVAIWVITRIPENFITGRGGRISENAILTEIFQIAFIVIVIAILALERKKKITN